MNASHRYVLLPTRKNQFKFYQIIFRIFSNLKFSAEEVFQYFKFVIMFSVFSLSFIPNTFKKPVTF